MCGLKGTNMRVNHTTTVTIDGVEHELEVQCDIAPAEHDVGIMSAYIDDWTVTAVDGNTSQSAIDAMHLAIEAEYGDEAFVEKLHNEGAADDAYDADYEPYD
jgi:ethanolamine utilization microcompartment shell protein EutL